MGNTSLNKDPHAKIFVSLKKNLCYAGEMMKGIIHINCIEDRLVYRSIRLNIYCVE